MNHEKGDTGYRKSEYKNVEVALHQGGDNEWHFTVEADGVHVLQGVLTEESVREIRGECGNIHTCLSVFGLLEDAASDYDECDVFPADVDWNVYTRVYPSGSAEWSYAGNVRAETETKALNVANDQYDGVVKVERNS
jgi:hypothetical protein